MIGELYAAALAGVAAPEVEHPGGRTSPLQVHRWLHGAPGDESLLSRCSGPTLDVGAGPGRLAVALAERGIPALAIDVTAYAVDLARARGVLALQRDVFTDLPGAGRWASVLLADGNIGIGGDPAALLRRARTLLGPDGSLFAELGPPGAAARRERVRLRTAASAGETFAWAWVGMGQIGHLATAAGLAVSEVWSDAGRWFAALRRGPGTRRR